MGNVAYVGGEFTSLAPTTALAGAIDGQSGAPQPGFPKVDSGEVIAATPDGKGGWFVGGSFAKLNDVQVNGLAHILADGTLDTNFQPALVGTQNQPSKSFTVNALALSGSWLYVGGEFTKFGARGNTKAQTRNHIARVSPTTGHGRLRLEPRHRQQHRRQPGALHRRLTRRHRGLLRR